MKSESEQKRGIKKNDEETQQEILEIFRQAREIKGRQLTVSADTGELEEIDELRNLITTKMEDPQLKHSLYYEGIQNLLIKYLPKGDAFAAARQFIYDEKNVFATRGHKKDASGRRGADSRMAYNEDLKELVEVVGKWIIEGCDPYSLYLALYDLNEKYGYGHQEYDQTSKYFQKGMQRQQPIRKGE
jgi:hypothetical protein